ncbi:methanobactin export MATE transporter MbnM [Paraliomyxa miuraensis]|uniref:methanobactin export MATE transporter MbnM n=1 Tax=Paraliomyxa miuraensis TaxID=376150 RepID=UPI0022536CB6|nr:methanobactin export MATE transporter MbnM [Paraliomyxa miuraensis]MCX4241472.1 di-heme enzyme [Paraliomyxa miuraensis]
MSRWALAALPLVVACHGGEAEPYAWRLPPHFPEPWVPDDAPMSEAKVELGRHLFYEERLSVSGTISCGTCHVQALAFTDGRATSIGADGHAGTRSSMTLANVAHQPTLTWGNPVLDTLEAQALVPLFLDVPLELGAQYVIVDVLEEMAADEYRARFVDAFPDQDDPFTVGNVAAALAAFQRTLSSGDSPYDRHLRGEPGGLSPAAERGLALFESSRLRCAGCHGGLLLASDMRSADDPEATARFENTGLYDLGAGGGYPPPNVGLFEFTGESTDMGRHRIPSLRNIAVTAPYMHDGSIADLDGVLDHYAAGGRTLSDGPWAGVGADNPNKSPLVAGFELTAAERADLVAFLEALTDEAFLVDPRFSDPTAG